MNEKLKYLLWKSGVHYGDPWSNVNPKVIENYTGLILQECLEICQNHYTIEGIAQNIEKDIKENFGIEYV